MSLVTASMPDPLTEGEGLAYRSGMDRRSFLLGPLAGGPEVFGKRLQLLRSSSGSRALRARAWTIC